MKKILKNSKQAYEFYNEGLIKAKQERYSESIQALNEAIKIDRYYVKAYNLLGKVYLHEGEIQKAQECWLTTLSIDELNPTAIACLNALNQESFSMKLKNVLPAVFLFCALAAFLVLILRMDVNIKNLELKLVDMNNHLTSPEIKSPPKAVQQEDESMDMKPELKSPPMHEITPVLAETPRPLSHEQVEDIYNRARALFESGKYDMAIAEFQKILNSNSDSHLMDNTQYWLADCYYNKGEYALSLESFEKVKDFPDGNKIEDASKKADRIKTLIYGK